MKEAAVPRGAAQAYEVADEVTARRARFTDRRRSEKPLQVLGQRFPQAPVEVRPFASVNGEFRKRCVRLQSTPSTIDGASSRLSFPR